MALVSCAAHPPQFDALNRFLGGPLQAIIDAYGEPTDSSPLASGDRRLVWHYFGSRLMAGQREPPTISVTPTGAPVYVRGRRKLGQIKAVSCTLQVDADGDGRVRTWQAQGNACPEALANPQAWR